MSILKTFCLFSKPVLGYISIIFCKTNFLRLWFLSAANLGEERSVSGGVIM